MKALSLRSPYDREIGALAIPALGSLIADPLLSLVDTSFVARIGTSELGALGVASALFAVSFFIFNFLEYGTTSEVARASGAGDHEAAGRAVVTSLAMALVAGVVVLGFLEGFAGSLVRALGGSGDLEDPATTYVRIRALAAPAVLIVRWGHGTFRGIHDTRTPLWITLGINGINLVLDPLLIFGLGWGIAGAAWATVVAQWVGAVAFLWFVLGRNKDQTGVGGARPVAREVWHFLKVGRDLAIRTGSLLAVFTATTAIAARIGEIPVAAHQVLIQLFVFLGLGVDALAIAAQAMVGNRLGRGQLREAREVADRLLVFGIGVGALLLVALVAVKPVLPGVFTDDAAVIAEMAFGYWLLALLQPLNAAVFVWDGVFIGAGDFGYVAAAMVPAALAAGIVLVLVLPLGMGLAGVWWGVVVLMIVRGITLAWRRVSTEGPLHGR